MYYNRQNIGKEKKQFNFFVNGNGSIYNLTYSKKGYEFLLQDPIYYIS